MTQFIKYLKATMAEMRQVSWPTQKQTVTYAALVIVISALVALYVGALDYAFSRAIDYIITRF